MRDAFLAHLKKVVGDTSDAPWGDDNIPYLFQRFRPDGDGVALALSPAPDASAYVARLLQVYRATRHDDWARDMYFVVRHPPVAEETEIIALGEHFLTNLRILGKVIENDELSAYLASVKHVQILPPGQLNRRSDDHSLVYETIGDYFGCSDHDDPIAILRAAYYYIACDYDLVFYLQWPYYQRLCSVDCFEPYFRLWQHAFSYAFEGSTLNLAKR